MSAWCQLIWDANTDANPIRQERGLGFTWWPGGLQRQDELLRLQVEESDVAAGEGRHHVSRLAARQVHRGGNPQL